MSSGYAIVQSGGKQYRVREGDEILVDRLPDASGEIVKLTPLLVVGDQEALYVGRPLVDKSRVTAKIVEHRLGEKIHASTYKAKVGYRRKKGFRAKLTKLKIEKIVVGKEVKKKTVKHGKTKKKTAREVTGEGKT